MCGGTVRDPATGACLEARIPPIRCQIPGRASVFQFARSTAELGGTLMVHDVVWEGTDGEVDGERQRAFPRARLVEPLVSVGVADVAAGQTSRRGSALAVTARDPIVDRVACSRLSVLIMGESGAGKEVLARRLHERSPRAAGPLVAVNAAAVCESLLESELFGHERGAFTGAIAAKAGLIEAADGGTLFLDEVADLSLSAQAKLLRVLETKIVTRVGGVRARPVDIRIVAATNQDLGAAIAEGKFREDLWFRLNGIELYVPPLRSRGAEIVPAARQFLEEQALRDQLPIATLTEAAERALLDHDWPGNFRELRNVIERAAVICNEGRIEPADLLLPDRTNVDDGDDLDGPAASAGPSRTERQQIVDALSMVAGNQTRAARMLGMSRRTLISRLEILGIARPRTSLRVVAAKAS
jgi:two-component system response regulator AtoC